MWHKTASDSLIHQRFKPKKMKWQVNPIPKSCRILVSSLTFDKYSWFMLKSYMDWSWTTLNLTTWVLKTEFKNLVHYWKIRNSILSSRRNANWKSKHPEINFSHFEKEKPVVQLPNTKPFYAGGKRQPVNIPSKCKHIHLKSKVYCHEVTLGTELTDNWVTQVHDVGIKPQGMIIHSASQPLILMIVYFFS